MIQRWQFTLCFILTFCFIRTAVAQDGKPTDVQKSTLTITAVAAGERVRFTAPASVVQMRLEVYDASGNKLFDNELKGGSVLDWLVQNGQAERLPVGSYFCLVTVKSLSGKLAQKLGSVVIDANGVSLEAAVVAQMTTPQRQAVGPVEEESALTILQEGEPRSGMVIAHNGEEGQITRGRGALSFRVGDFFSGKDTEQMRLTAEGNLGIGITHPLVRLDVDGLIRASQGIMFPDGTIQTTAAIAGNPSQGNGGQSQTGQGSKPGKQSKVSGARGKGKDTVSPEFTVNEDLTVNGNIIFTPSLSRDITVQNNNGGIRIFANPVLTGSPATAAIQFFGNGHPGFPGQAYIDSGAHDQAAVIFRTAVTGGTIAERMRITATGNVGVGTPIPADKLMVQTPTNSYGLTHTDGTVTVGTYVGSGNSQNAGWLGTKSNHPLFFFTNNSGALMTLAISGNVGIGTTNPSEELHVLRSGDYQLRLENPASGGGFWNIGQADNSFHSGGGKLVFVPNSIESTNAAVVFTNDGRVSIGNPAFDPGVNSLYVSGKIFSFALETSIFKLNTLSEGGDETVCRNSSTREISRCSSSLRYKKEIAPFRGGLEILNHLRPIRFTWKASGSPDLGLGAEDVAAVEPLLVTHNDKGEIEGVRYAQLSAVFINAFKQQQAQLSRQQREIKQLKKHLRRLQVGAHKHRRSGRS